MAFILQKNEMNYQYKAVHPDGGVITGEIKAENLRTAIRILRQKGLNIVDLQSEAEKIISHSSRKRHPGSQDVLIFMQQFCTLLESGVPLEETVESLAESAGHPFLSQEFSTVITAIRRGVSFSTALKECKIHLPAYFYPLAEAGELTGKMPQAMRDGVLQWEYDLRTANEVQNALIYPSILIFSGISAVLLIFALVVPRFVKLLDKAQGDIPFLARLVLGMGSFVNANMIWLGMIGAGLIIFAGYAFFNPKIRQHIRDILAQLPFLKNWMLETEISRWAAMLSTLLENRVSLLNALELAQRHVTLTRFRASLSHVSRSVRNGAALGASLRDMNTVTSTGYNLIRVGERSGELPRMLRSLSSLYTEAGRNRMKRFLIILEPAAILVIGAMIGIIMGGIILAITSANNISL